MQDVHLYFPIHAGVCLVYGTTVYSCRRIGLKELWAVYNENLIKELLWYAVGLQHWDELHDTIKLTEMHGICMALGDELTKCFTACHAHQG